MYAFAEMIDLPGIKWKSKIHKQVAINLLIGNPRITKCQQLLEFGTLINNMTKEKVKSLTLMDAIALGFPVN
jgi:hypothetical protein